MRQTSRWLREERRAIVRWSTVVVVALIVGSVAGADDDLEDLSLSIQLARGTPRARVTIVARVLPDTENRLLRIAIDGPGYYRSSEVQLDGIASAIQHDLTVRDLPAALQGYVLAKNRALGSTVARGKRFRLFVPAETTRRA